MLQAQSALALAPQDFKGARTLVSFWRSDCPPCVREQEITPKIKSAHPNLRIEIISLEDKSQEEQNALLKLFGDAKHALPFSVMLRADGSVCRTHNGVLGLDVVNRWEKIC